MTQLFTPPSNRQANQARLDESLRQQRVQQGTSAINSTFDSQFNDGFYGARQQAYQDYANPQLQSQYDQARQQLTYALARSGGLDSSNRGSLEAQLQQQYDTAKRGVGDQALSYGNQARQSVEDARASLISSLNATGDAQQAASAATNRAQALSAQPAFNPIGSLFGDFTSALGTQAAAERATSLSGGTIYRSPYNTGLFSSAGSVRTST